MLNKVFKLSGDTGKVEHTIDVERDGVDSFESLIEQGIIEQGTKKKEGGRGSSNKIFADYIGSSNDNDDMQIVVRKGGVFTARRRRVRKGSNKRRSTYDLEFVFAESERLKGKNVKEKILSQGGSIENIDIERERVFNTKEFIDKANRPLYRTNPNIKGKQGDFFNDNAITPFNPLEIDPEYPNVKKRDKNPSAAPPRTKPQIKFIDRGGIPKLKITGSGKVKVGFKLKVNDNLRTSGVFARQVDIQTDNGFIQLKRDITERVTTGRGGGRTVLEGSEREELFGSGIFTAGQEYDIQNDSVKLWIWIQGN